MEARIFSWIIAVDSNQNITICIMLDQCPSASSQIMINYIIYKNHEDANEKLVFSSTDA